MLQVEERVKSRVAREIRRIERSITSLKAEARPEEMESAGDNTPFSEVADATQVAEEREIRSQRLDSLLTRVVDLGRALRRIDEGTYGVCVRCDGFIHPERLRARPEATLCLECQRTVESEKRAAGPTPFVWLEAADRERQIAESD